MGWRSGGGIGCFILRTAQGMTCIGTTDVYECFVLKFLNEPPFGAGRAAGVVISQIMLESPRSIGARKSARANIRTKARKKAPIIAATTTMTSRSMGMAGLLSDVILSS